MTELDRYLAAAFKAERASARRLALREGLSEEQALRATLERSAAPLSLQAMLAQREAISDAATERGAARAQREAEALAVRKARHEGAATPWRGWFDGSAHPNPGRCGIGALLTGPNGERDEVSRDVGYGDSGEAEYQALIALLEAALRRGAHELTIYGDSRVVIDDMNGVAGASAASLRAYRIEAGALMAQLRQVSLRWIPRQKNGEADALSQRAVVHAAVASPSSFA
ncbi:MAG: ribonuclease HI family protein [Massilia sp.]